MPGLLLRASLELVGVALRLRAGLHELATVGDKTSRTSLPVLLRVAQLVGGRERDLLGAQFFLHLVLREAVLSGHGESKGHQGGRQP